MIITENVYKKIIRSLNLNDMETGGMIGGSGNIITEFYFDLNGMGHLGSYIPDVHSMNMILEKWIERGIHFKGLIHTHKKNKYLSDCDLHYGKRIIISINCDIILGVFVLKIQKLFFYQLSLKDEVMHVKRIDYQISE